jgi:[ribosomal protein S18]-alanine N-acetyltransferase
MRKNMVSQLNDYVIADMNIENIDDVVNIERLSFRIPWSKEAFMMEIEKNKCAKYRVLLKEGKVIAYGGMWIVVDEAHITNIAVHPDYRGIGLGNAIVEDMINLARSLNITSMTLEVRISNTPAIKLYSKYGFKETARRKGYYADTREDAIIMWRQEN